tara:strand:- start:471 stop:884 length:414 start_codon:yes stop_codon:yes gene_type:complete
MKGNWWWAKEVSKPAYNIESEEYILGNNKFKYPGVLTWEDIEISIVDTGQQTDSLYKNLNKMGYLTPDASSKGIEKQGNGSVKTLSILQVDESGKTVEKWDLMNAFISAVQFGSLNYTSDELVEIRLTVKYDWAVLS